MICIYDSQENTEDSFAASVYFPEFMRVSSFLVKLFNESVGVFKTLFGSIKIG
jgi:hypothetical protein